MKNTLLLGVAFVAFYACNAMSQSRDPVPIYPATRPPIDITPQFAPPQQQAQQPQGIAREIENEPVITGKFGWLCYMPDGLTGFNIRYTMKFFPADQYILSVNPQSGITYIRFRGPIQNPDGSVYIRTGEQVVEQWTSIQCKFIRPERQ